MKKYIEGEIKKVRCNNKIYYGTVTRILKRGKIEKIEIVWIGDNGKKNHMYINREIEDYEEQNYEEWIEE